MPDVDILTKQTENLDLKERVLASEIFDLMSARIRGLEEFVFSLSDQTNRLHAQVIEMLKREAAR